MSHRRNFILAGISGLTALFTGKSLAGAQSTKKEIKTADAPPAIGPYSQGIQAGDFIFLSGQIALHPKTGKLEAGGVEQQAHRVFKNLVAVLKAAGTDMGAVVKATVFLKDLNNYSRVNKIYATYFKAPFPARAAVEVPRLPKDVEIEVEVIAYNP